MLDFNPFEMTEDQLLNLALMLSTVQINDNVQEKHEDRAAKIMGIENQEFLTYDEDEAMRLALACSLEEQNPSQAILLQFQNLPNTKRKRIDTYDELPETKKRRKIP